MLNKRINYLFLSFFLVFCSCHNILSADLELRKSVEKGTLANEILKPYLLPHDHPLRPYLKMIFSDPTMFESADHLKKAGFKVMHGHRKLMVGQHPLISQYLFKKFPNSLSQDRQLDNFMKRLRGAEILRNYINDHHFKHLVVPKKWLYKLPKSFSQGDENRAYVLIVENMDIYRDFDKPDGIARQLYYNMDIEMLTELCTILRAVGGCDAFPRNQPFTRSGKIAFVDTEHVGRMKNHFIKHIIPALNEELQAYAWALWTKLEEEEQIKNSLK